MSDPSLVFVDDSGERPAVVVNFAVHAGREATPAELDRLADGLLEHVDSLELVTEQRIEASRTARASVYQVRAELPEGAPQDAIVSAVDTWARDCIAERRLIAP